MVYLNKKFHTHKYKGFISSALKWKAKFWYYSTAILLSYILNKTVIMKITYFTKLYYHKQFLDITTSFASMMLITVHYITFPGSKVSQNDRKWQEMYKIGVASNGMKFILTLLDTYSVVQKLLMEDRRIYT
jgi:hypothetical protein